MSASCSLSLSLSLSLLVQLAFLMEHVEIKDESSLHLQHKTKQLKCKLRCEVKGFEHNMDWDQ